MKFSWKFLNLKCVINYLASHAIFRGLYSRLLLYWKSFWPGANWQCNRKYMSRTSYMSDGFGPASDVSNWLLCKCHGNVGMSALYSRISLQTRNCPRTMSSRLVLSLALCMRGSIYAQTFKKLRGHINPSVYGPSVRLLKKKVFWIFIEIFLIKK